MPHGFIPLASRLARRARSKRGILGVCLIAAASALPVAPVLGQSITIREPVEWRAERAITLSAGASIRVLGSASYPSGVARVLIGARAAKLKPDQDFPDISEFEVVIPADSITGDVTVAIISKNGERYERPFKVANPNPRVVAKAPVVAPAEKVAAPQVVTQPPKPIVRSNPWGPFRMRSIGYGLVAVGGAVLATMSSSSTSEVCSQGPQGSDCVNRTSVTKNYQGVGYGLVGAALVAGVVDAMRTSKRAGQLEADAAPARSTRVRVALPNVTASDRGVSLQILQLQFR